MARTKRGEYRFGLCRQVMLVALVLQCNHELRYRRAHDPATETLSFIPASLFLLGVSFLLA